MMKASGSSALVVEKMYTKLDSKTAGFPNPKGKPLAILARELHIHQLYPGENLSYLGERFVSYFEQHLDLQSMADQRSYVTGCGDSVTLPLMIWVSDFTIRGGQRAYFGDYLEEIDPDISWSFLEFDDFSWQILYQYPKFLCRKMINAKDKVTAALERYFATPMGQRSGDAWFTKAIEQEMRSLDLNTKDISIMMQTIYWG